MAFWVLPPQGAAFLSLLATVVFVGAPILALFSAARFPWTALHATTMLIMGVAFHLLGHFVGKEMLGGAGLSGIALLALGQSGLLLWCLGLGALVSLKITDKNMLVPISLFLAGFDVFLVFSPVGPTKVLVQQQPAVFQAVAMSVPKVATEPRPVGAPVEVLAYVGPADLFFLAMFFVALFRFKMRTRETLIAMIPVLVAYLLVVLFLGGVRLGPVSLSMLPALLPIGLTILIVNAREFTMSAQEKAVTFVAGLIAAAIALTGIILAARAKPASQPAPSPKVGVPAPSGSGGSLPPVSPDRPQ